MTQVNQADCEKTLAEQIADLVKRKPQHYDVVFSVGPERIEVRALKIILKAASPVFESEFEDNWESAVVNEGNGIPLPYFDPTVFQVFVNLIISDTWSVEALTSLNLPVSFVLSLLGLCRHYKITKAIRNLEEVADDFIQKLNEFKDTAEYLEISLETLETILSCDAIPLDEKEIFDSVCRWAQYQCQQKNIESTGENFREILGPCFFEIRFPTMTTQDFKKVSLVKKNLFTAIERSTIYDFIATEEENKAKYDKSHLLFKTKPRGSFGCSVLFIPEQFKIKENVTFACDGIEQSQGFKVNQKIQLHGVGFLGPIKEDAQFEITVQIKQVANSSWTFDSGTFRKNIFARKGKIFYFLFDTPITIETSTLDSEWGHNNHYLIYTLKGAGKLSQYNAETPKEKSVHSCGLEFMLAAVPVWQLDSPLAQLLFKKI